MSPPPVPTSVVASSPPCLGGNSDNTRWFREEVEPHEPALRNYLRNRFPSIDTDEVVQECYLKLLKVRAQGTVASARTYAFAIARNLAVSIFRRRKFLSSVPVDELPEWTLLDHNPDAAAVAQARQRMALAEEAIDNLPVRCREIVRLAAFEQLRPAEIAAKLGIAESTVYVQLARGFKKCAEYLREAQ